MFGFNCEYPAVHPKVKFSGFLLKNCKKSAVKHSIEKPVLLKILVFEKGNWLSKLIFKATQLQKIPEYDIFQNTLFCTSASSINLD